VARLSPLAHSFLPVIKLCESDEQIAYAWAAAVEKAIIVGWYKKDIPDEGAVNTSILRAAERAAHDFH